ncbi:MAG: T9SS type A sorting domain-containing protein [Bacteroidetes bacterium]|nr:T9SS type A sorting domain-containing protein [Bacteroidota bacterium]
MNKNVILMFFLSALSALSAKSAVQTTCPFVGGTAVYQARVLWAMYNPIMQYNDRLNCIQNVGQNKNGNNEYINLDSLLEAQVNEQSQKSAEQIKNISTNHLNIKSQIKIEKLEEISVYPNPANTQIIISYSNESDGHFTLFNAVGNIVLTTSLLKTNNKTQILLNDVANGIYTYEVEFNNKNKSFGKLTILK